MDYPGCRWKSAGILDFQDCWTTGSRYHVGLLSDE